MTKLKTITPSSWLVLEDDGKKAGLLSKTLNTYTLLQNSRKKQFSTKEEIEKYLGNNIFVNVESIKESNKTSFVRGFPVAYETAFEVETKDELPLFTKTPASNSIHAAGYYCVNYPNGWLQSFCPKIETLQKYGYVGPFYTKLEMRTKLSDLQRKQRNERN